MQMKWPSLPDMIMKIISLCCFAVCVVLEIVDYHVLYNKKDSHCVAGYELAEEIGVHVITSFGVLISDMVYVVLVAAAIPFPNCNFGADLLTIGYNFVSGFLQYASMSGISSAVPCGNNDFFTIQNTTVSCMTLASLLHWINGIISLLFVSQTEQTKKRRRSQPE